MYVKIIVIIIVVLENTLVHSEKITIVKKYIVFVTNR